MEGVGNAESDGLSNCRRIANEVNVEEKVQRVDGEKSEAVKEQGRRSIN